MELLKFQSMSRDRCEVLRQSTLFDLQERVPPYPAFERDRRVPVAEPPTHNHNKNSPHDQSSGAMRGSGLSGPAAVAPEPAVQCHEEILVTPCAAVVALAPASLQVPRREDPGHHPVRCTSYTQAHGGTAQGRRGPIGSRLARCRSSDLHA